MTHKSKIALIAVSFFYSVPSAQVYDWAKRVGRAGSDQSWEMEVDGAGNSHLVGSFSDTVDFDPGPGTADLICTGLTNVFFAKYDSAGNYVWAKNITGVGNNYGNDIALDDSGNVYIVGIFRGTSDFNPGPGLDTISSIPNGGDIFFAKYDANGNYVWAKRIGTASVGDDICNSIAVDAGGNVCITGAFYGAMDFDPGSGTATLTAANSIESIYFAKYDSNGVYVWAEMISPTSTDSKGLSIRFDLSGNVLVSGVFRGTADFDPGSGTANRTSNTNTQDIFCAKYDSNGNYVWAFLIGSVGMDIGYGLTIDNSGNVYLTGFFQGTADFDPGTGAANLTVVSFVDVFFAKYDS